MRCRNRKGKGKCRSKLESKLSKRRVYFCKLFFAVKLFELRQGFGDALTWIVHPEEELTWKATCDLTTIGQVNDEPIFESNTEFENLTTTSTPIEE